MRLSHDALVLVADGEKMLLFRNEGDARFPVLETLAHHEIDNPSTHDQGEDRPGRSFASVGARRSGYSETDWHAEAEERFAIDAADRLVQRAAGNEREVVVIAPPRVLGQLRKRFGAHVAKRITAEIPKDLVHHITDDIVKAITSHSA